MNNVINKATVDLIKGFEGLRLKAYQDSVGVWTIGYGHTAMSGPPAPKAGMIISSEEAEAILKDDVTDFAKGVAAVIKVPVTDNEFGAIVSFAFNVGLGNLKASTLLKKLNAGDKAGAANEFAKWNKAGGKVLTGLTRRRAAEKALFLKG